LALLRGGFSETGIRLLGDRMAVIATTFRQFWRCAHSRLAIPSAGGPIDSMLDRLGQARLTNRERQVAQHILKGHSSDSISRRLGISVTTVKTHRKNLYAKLGIATQQELFSRVLDSVSVYAPGALSGH